MSANQQVEELMRRQPLNNLPSRGEIPGEKSDGLEVFDEPSDAADGEAAAPSVESDNPFRPR